MRRKQSLIWSVATAIILSGGVISCVFNAQADTWWNKPVGYENPALAKIINQMNQPLIISDNYDVNLGKIISLSYLLEPQVRLQLVQQPMIPKISKNCGDVFLFNPSPRLKEGIKKQFSSQLKLIYGNNFFRLSLPQLCPTPSPD